MPIPNGGDGDSIGKGCVLWLDSRYFTESFWWDISKYRNNGVVHGAKWKANSFYFDGSNDYIDCGSNSYLQFDDKITIVAWIKPESISRYPVIVLNGNNDWREGYVFYLRSQADNMLRLGVNTGTKLRYGTAGNIDTEKWTYVAGSFDGSNIYLYINNIKYTPTVNSADYTQNMDATKVGYGLSVLDYFHGNIGMLFIFHKVLSEQEINILYNLTYRR